MAIVKPAGATGSIPSGGTGPAKAPLPAENMSGHTKKLRFLLEHLRRYIGELGRPIDLLDFGCGNGGAVSRFLMLDGVRYFGVDSHEPSRSYATRNFGGEHAVFLDRVPSGVRFDVVVCSDILEHVDDPRALLASIAGAHREGGLLLGSVPNGYGPFENEKRLDRWLRLSAILDIPARIGRNLRPAPPAAPSSAAVPYNADSGHVQFFTKRSLISTVESASYRIGEFRNGAFAGAPLTEKYLFRGEGVARANARIADLLPYWAVSTWYFTAIRGR